jgi:hypothetical protein
MKTDVLYAADHLLKNFDEEFTAEGSDKSTLGHTPQKAEILYSDGESSLGDSSLNHVSYNCQCFFLVLSMIYQSTVMFMNNEQFRYIAESLDKHKSPEVSVASKNVVSPT